MQLEDEISISIEELRKLIVERNKELDADILHILVKVRTTLLEALEQILKD